MTKHFSIGLRSGKIGGHLQGEHCTIDRRLPFCDSVGGIFPGPATTQKVYQGIEWFSQLAGLQYLTVLGILIRGMI